jgi:hypothetical protein
MLENRGRFVTIFLLAIGGLAACSAGSTDGQGAPGTGGLGGFPTGGGGSGSAMGAGGVGPAKGGVPGASGSTSNGGFIDQIPSKPPNDGDAGCKSAVGKGELLPLDIFIMFDQSQSMDCATSNGGNRWNAVKQALTSFVNDPGAAGIGVGLQFFGDNGLQSSCDAATYSTADVPIAPLPGNAGPIASSLNNHRPTTNTPSLPALDGAIQHARDWKRKNPGHTVIVLFVTDGQPNACSPGPDMVEPVVQVAKAGLESAEKMNTYVIGIVSEGVACPRLDPAPPTKADLDRVAVGGGTTTSFMVDVNQNASQKFLEAINKIRIGAQPPCEYQLPEPDEGKKLDPNFVNVNLTNQAGAATTIFRVNGSGACNPSIGGWYYDNEAAPTKILLCPATCSGAGKIGSTVSLKFGCVESARPPA